MFTNLQEKLNKAQGAFSLDALQDGDAYMEELSDRNPDLDTITVLAHRGDEAPPQR